MNHRKQFDITNTPYMFVVWVPVPCKLTKTEQKEFINKELNQKMNIVENTCTFIF